MAGRIRTDLSYTTASYDGQSNMLTFDDTKFRTAGDVQDVASGKDNADILGDINKGQNTSDTTLPENIYQRDGFESKGVIADAGHYVFLYYYGTVEVNGVTGFLASDNKFLKSGQKWYVFFPNEDLGRFPGKGQTTGTLHLSTDGDNTFDLTCFLSGTEIELSSGNVLVQNVQVGDRIMTYRDGKKMVDRVSWVGKARSVVRPGLPDDFAGYPVRILKNALSENVPFKDMLVTSEHCLFFDGKFVPVRMLVNGQSVFYDMSFSSYDYYHIETENHSIIMADGVLTESYLDTGNRRIFHQDGDVVSVAPVRNLTWNEAAAPLDVSRAFVEPLFRQIKARAGKVTGFADCRIPKLTDEADLHLLTEAGHVLRPLRKTGKKVLFSIPVSTQRLWIVSNASRPCDTIGPFVDDRRELGVLVGSIALYRHDSPTPVTTHLESRILTGWNDLEASPMRWTSGCAELPLPQGIEGEAALLALEILSSGPYLVQSEEGENIDKVA